MGTTVDKRVVDVQFNNQQFEHGAQTSIKTLENLKKGLNFTESTKGLSNLSKIGSSFSLSGITNGISSAISKFGLLEIVGITALVSLTNSAVMAGKRIVESLTIEPIMKGFSEYEIKMGSIQTIMAGTGESLEKVKIKLEELNDYSDKTIYSFSDMTTNIGKFTNAGVSLTDSVAAIKGIANAAALSGSNANEASRAMYNFSQALSSGYVKLIDWKSIELANMATLEFKNQLIESAVAVGTLTKAENGMYRTLKGELINATTNFNTSLEDQWMTTKVLTTTLGKYSDETTNIGKRATEAAQKVKTFTQLISTLQEGVGSGWAKTWELIFGDFDEAKTLFTGINNTIGKFIENSSNARNDMLSTWKTLGGRTMVIMAVKNAFNALSEVLSTVKEAFGSVFPPITYETLLSISRALINFSLQLRLGKLELDYLKRTFAGVASVIDLVRLGFITLFKPLANFGGNIRDSLFYILRFTAGIGDWLVKLRDGIRYQNLLGETFGKIKIFLNPAITAFQLFLDILSPIFEKIKAFLSETFKNIDTSGIDKLSSKITGRFEPIKTLFTSVGKVFMWLYEVLKSFSPIFEKVFGIIGKGLSNLGSIIIKGLDNINYNNLFDGLNSGLLAALVLSIKKFLGKSEGAFDSIVSVFDGVRGSLEAWQSSIKAGTLLTIASAVGILTLSIISLSFIDSEKLSKSLTAITVMFGQLVTSLSILDKIPGGVNTAKTAGALITISASVLLLSFAVSKLSKINSNDLMKGLLGIGTLLAELALFMKITELSGMGIARSSGLLVLAVSVNVLGIAVGKFALLDPAQIQKGLTAIGAVLLELATFTKLTSNSKNVFSTAIGLTILGGAMMIFAEAVKRMGAMSLDEIGRGLLTMGGSLSIVTAALRLMPKNIPIMAGGLVIVAGALLILSKALKSMGGMSWEEVGRGLVVLGGSLIIIAIGLKAMMTGLPGAAAMLVMAGALMVFAPALKLLGSMSLEEIGLSLLMLAGMFTIFGVAGLVLGPITPILLGLSGAMFLFGLACLAVGAGTLAFSTGLAALAVSGTAGAAAISLIVASLLSTIPMIATAIAEGIMRFVDLISKSAPTLVSALVTTLRVLINGIVTLIPEFVTAIMTLVLSLVQTLVDNAPKLVKAGMDLIVALLQGIADNIGRVVDSAFNIIEEFLRAIGKKIPEVVDSGFKMIIDFIDGITKAIEENVPVLIESGRRLAKAIVDGISKALLAGITDVTSAIKNVGDAALQGLKDILGIKSPSTETFDIARYAMIGLVNGIKFFGQDVITAAKSVGGKIVDGFSIGLSTISDALNGNMDFSPVIKPVVDLSAINGTGREIDKLLTTRPISLATSASLSRSAFSEKSPTGSELEQSKSTPGTIVTLNQNNYSPEALSRIEIYRQTRNQLQTLKGLVQSI